MIEISKSEEIIKKLELERKVKELDTLEDLKVIIEMNESQKNLKYEIKRVYDEGLYLPLTNYTLN